MLPKLRFLILFVILLSVSVHSTPAQPVWENGPVKIYLQNNILELTQNNVKISEIISIAFNFIAADTILVEKVQPDTLTLRLSFTEKDGFHEDFPASILLSITAADNAIHFFTGHPAFNHITIRLRDQNEHYFGLVEKLFPYNAKNPDLRGTTVDLDVYGLEIWTMQKTMLPPTQHFLSAAPVTAVSSTPLPKGAINLPSMA